MEVIQPGSVVRLKCGGPLMVVASVGSDQVEVFWFCGPSDMLQRANFPMVVLESGAAPKKKSK
jgi:uncharacterized protein YodC (DUF2158 family)